jgi:predicted RNase H-like nuclease (RuvC/YqgF family)
MKSQITGIRNPKSRRGINIRGINMMNQDSLEATGRAIAPLVRMRMLLQMAEALEDEAGSLYRRAGAFEQEEFLLNREIEERQTEISRLQLKLEALRSTRNALVEKIESLRSEADTMRGEVFNNEEVMALARASDRASEGWAVPARDEESRDSVFFQRMSL